MAGAGPALRGDRRVRRGAGSLALSGRIGQSAQGYEIPAPNIARCGLKVAAKAQDWEALVPDEAPNAQYVAEGLRQLRQLSDAPLLGSLLDPARSLKNDLLRPALRL